MTSRMRSSLGRKAEFFVLTAVVIVGAFYSLSKYISPYSFIDTSKAVENDEFFFFENVKEKAIKTVKIGGDDTTLNNNLNEYKNFVKKMASEKGYIFDFNYTIQPTYVNISMLLISEKKTLSSSFSVPRTT